MKNAPKPAEWTILAHLFDEINQSFINYDGQAAFLLKAVARLVPRARTALDLGCGTGLHATLLAEHGLDTVGIDLSPRLLRQGQRRRSGVRLVAGTIEALPFRARFDLVYALNFVMSFLLTNDALLHGLSEVRRVLSPRGIFIMDYHYYFPPEKETRLRRKWHEKCEVRGQKLLITHDPTVDWDTQLCTDEITYRFARGRLITRELKTREVRRISLPQDLACLLRAAGFELLAHCGRFDLEAKPAETGVFIARRRRNCLT